MIQAKSSSGLTLFTGTAVLLLIFWLPVNHILLPGVNQYFMLACLWIGLIYTIAMQSHRTTGYRVTLFPVFQGYLALTGFTFLQETGFIVSVFLGMYIYNIRIGETLRNCFFHSMKTMLICLLSLRITTLLLQEFRDRILVDEFLSAAALTAAVLMVMLLNQLFRFLVAAEGIKNIKHAAGMYLRSIIYSGLYVLVLLPAATNTKESYSGFWDWYLLVGVVTILVIQSGLSILLDRARFSYSRTLFLENELGKHSDVLANLDTPLDALRVLANFWYQASEPKAVRVTWNNISMTYPAGVEPSDKPAISRKGKEGLVLEVWPSPRTTLDRERIEIFILQSETVLKNLELRDSVYKSGWDCLEAMVYSLDMSDSRQTGYSRIVATIAKEIGQEMKLPDDDLEDLEMSAMLHLAAAIIEKAEEDWQDAFASDPGRIQFQLPPGVVTGIKHMNENYDGSGKPDGLSGKSIPVISRILSVASNFAANISDRSIDEAIIELKRRSGLIYDPDIVDILDKLSAQRDKMFFSDYRA